jgi:hypothetical protein
MRLALTTEVLTGRARTGHHQPADRPLGGGPPIGPWL